MNHLVEKEDSQIIWLRRIKIVLWCCEEAGCFEEFVRFVWWFLVFFGALTHTTKGEFERGADKIEGFEAQLQHLHLEIPKNMNTEVSIGRVEGGDL